MAKSSLSSVDFLGVVFQARLEQAWGFYHSIKHDEAKTTAAKLLTEPHLGPLHQASMHMLLGSTGLDPDAPHVEEAARIYGDLLKRQDLSTEHRGGGLEENYAIADYLIEEKRNKGNKAVAGVRWW